MYWDASCVYHGFVRAASGTITTFNAPGAGTGGGQGTAAIGINTAGAVTGAYTDARNVYHGFVRAGDGTITTFDAPGAGTGVGMLVGTVGLGINVGGAVTGAYTDANGVAHGFVRAANGTITTFDAPSAGTGAGLIRGILGLSINDAGAVTGAYTDGSGVGHAFVRAADGTITNINAPGAGMSTSLLQGAGSLSINLGGAVTGAYTDASGVAHGFVFTP